MSNTMYFKDSRTGALRKIDGGLLGKGYGWNVKDKKWVESEYVMRILDPGNDMSFWNDEISEDEAKEIMRQ